MGKLEFQSPPGEVVKETSLELYQRLYLWVSIPSRGSGKGDFFVPSYSYNLYQSSFNPLSGKW